MTDKRAPVQGYTGGIPWEMHLRAYDAYVKKHGRQQALIEGGCRGGFSAGELDDFIPGWRQELSLVAQLQNRIKQLEEVVAWANNSLYGSHGFFLSMNGGTDDLMHLARGIEVLKDQTRITDDMMVPQLGGAPDDLRNLIKVVFADMSLEQMGAACKQVIQMRKVQS